MRWPIIAVGTLLGVVFGVVFGGAAPAAAQDDASYEELVAQAIEAYDAHEPARALELFEAARALRPGPRVLRGVAMCQAELGRWLEAHATILEALALDDASPSLSAELRAQLERELLPRARAHLALWLVPPEATLRIDGAPVATDAEGVAAVAPGEHEVELSADDGRHVTARVEARAGEVRRVPLAWPDAPEAEADADGGVVIEPLRPSERPSITFVEAPEHADLRPPFAMSTRFSAWAHGTVGAWQGGRNYVPAAGFGFTFAVMTRFARELGVGGQLEGTWAGLLDTCGPYLSGSVVRASDTCGWFRIGLRLAAEIHFEGSPLTLVVAAGFGFAFLGRPEAMTAGGPNVTSAWIVPLDGMLRWYVLEDVLFFEAGVRSAIGPHADVGLGISVGVQP